MGAGLTPMIRRKRRLKVERSLKPASNAMAEMLSSVRRRRTAAVQARVQHELMRRHA
jgi:hypothetical protein